MWKKTKDCPVHRYHLLAAVIDRLTGQPGTQSARRQQPAGMHDFSQHSDGSSTTRMVGLGRFANNSLDRKSSLEVSETDALETMSQFASWQTGVSFLLGAGISLLVSFFASRNREQALNGSLSGSKIKDTTLFNNETFHNDDDGDLRKALTNLNEFAITEF
ncbi:hypothetical protein CIHG_01298 [Coccidioides immitis H538.4]|uniref:Uncharacterized protein n=1 Tax=Coccidioides immitis H538.4 TaxID=396776 RepID=A0A0J8RE59_COCIT|nr:hypothetical protein CIHG_01298 [Coccidioides immitis H538.4]